MPTQHAASAYAKVKWLLENPKLWEGLPSYDEYAIKHECAGKLRRLGEAARAAGLYAKTTYRLDVEMSLLKHIVEARRVRREGERNGKR